MSYWFRDIYFGSLFPYFRYIRFVYICHHQFNLLYYLLYLKFVPFSLPFGTWYKYAFGTSRNFDYNQSNSCCFLLSELKLNAFLRHFLRHFLRPFLRVVSLEFLNMLTIKINYILYSGLIIIYTRNLRFTQCSHFVQ